jgi:oxidase EvaA
VEANGIMVLGLFTSVMDGVRKFLVKVRHEPGCFDTAELSPSVQLEPSNPRTKLDSAEKLFLEKLERNDGVMKDVILSEEGGRFYHEQNRNVILEVRGEELPDLPEDYYWVDYRTLNTMIRFNNVMNIQLRNLLSILDL